MWRNTVATPPVTNTARRTLTGRAWTAGVGTTDAICHYHTSIGATAYRHHPSKGSYAPALPPHGQGHWQTNTTNQLHVRAAQENQTQVRQLPILVTKQGTANQT